MSLSAKNGFLEYVARPLSKEADLNNPIRLRIVSDSLAAELFPGLSVFTTRAKYFGLIVYWARHGLLGNQLHHSRLDQLLYAAHYLIGKEEGNTFGLVGKSSFENSPMKGNYLIPNTNAIGQPSYSRYKNPVHVLLLLENKKVKEDNPLSTALIHKAKDFPKNAKFLSAVRKFVKEGKKIDLQKYRIHLEKWKLDNMSKYYIEAIRTVIGLNENDSKDSQKNNLSNITRYYESLIEKNGQGFSSRKLRFFRSKDEKSFLDSWVSKHRSYSGFLYDQNDKVKIKPLLIAEKVDHIIFFKQTIFDSLYFAIVNNKGKPFKWSDLPNRTKGKDGILEFPGLGEVKKLRSKVWKLFYSYSKSGSSKDLILIMELCSEALNYLKINSQREFSIIHRKLYRGMAFPLLNTTSRQLTCSEWVKVISNLHVSYAELRKVNPWINVGSNDVSLNSYKNYEGVALREGNEKNTVFNYRIYQIGKLIEELAR